MEGAAGASIIVASIAIIPATIASLSSWRHVKESKAIIKGNGHGNVTAIVERIESKVDSALEWQGTHEATHVRVTRLIHDAIRSSTAAMIAANATSEILTVLPNHEEL